MLLAPLPTATTSCITRFSGPLYTVKAVAATGLAGLHKHFYVTAPFTGGLLLPCHVYLLLANTAAESAMPLLLKAGTLGAATFFPQREREVTTTKAPSKIY